LASSGAKINFLSRTKSRQGNAVDLKLENSVRVEKKFIKLFRKILRAYAKSKAARASQWLEN